MGMIILPLGIKILLESNPLEVQNLRTETGCTPQRARCVTLTPRYWHFIVVVVVVVVAAAAAAVVVVAIVVVVVVVVIVVIVVVIVVVVVAPELPPHRANAGSYMAPPPGAEDALRKGTNGVGTNGVTASFMFFDRDFLDSPVNLLLSSQKCRGAESREPGADRPADRPGAAAPASAHAQPGLDAPQAQAPQARRPGVGVSLIVGITVVAATVYYY